MAITAQQVKELRDRTGVAMMACKKALEESNGDIEGAVEVLRKIGAAKAAGKSDRSTSEGRVSISGRAIIKLLCETDFVGKNDDFVNFAQSIADKGNESGVDAAKAYFDEFKTDKIQKVGENLVLETIDLIEGGSTVAGYIHTNGKIGVLIALDGGTEEQAKDIAMHAAAMNPLCANPEDVDQDLIEKEKEIAREQLTNEGKPENIIENIITGKIKKFCAGQALTSQTFVKDPSMTVAEYLGDAKLVKFVRVAI